MRRGMLPAGLVAAVGITAALALAASSNRDEGVIGPANHIQPSGRKLKPVGKLTRVGNHPGGAAMTTNGRFYWTVSAGRGLNDVRIVRVSSRIKCKKPRRPHRASRRASKRVKRRYKRRLRAYKHRKRRYNRCARRRRRQIGKVVQTIPLPGASGGIAMAPDGRTAYVSGLPETTHKDQQTPAGTPGKEGDVIHVFHYSGRSGKAARAGTIPVPVPANAPIPQDFPPTTFTKRSWPRDIGISADGSKLLVALNLSDSAAIVDVGSKAVRYVKTGRFPYGAAITANGRLGLVSNEADGTVSVIDMARATKLKDIQVGPHLSHPEGIVIDPRISRAYVAVTQQDVVAVIDTARLNVARTLSVGRPQGIGTKPVDVNITSDGCFLMSSDAGEDAIAVFAVPRGGGKTCKNDRRSKKAKKSQVLADRILSHEASRGARQASAGDADDPEDAAASKAKRRSRAWELVGRIPVGSYPVDAQASPKRKTLVWLSAKGLGVGPNPHGPDPTSKNDSDDNINSFQYLPSIVRGASGVTKFPTDTTLRKLTPRSSKQIRPINGEKPPPRTPIRAPGAGQKIKHVFYIVRENRTYDQILGDDPRGDGDPKLALFGKSITPNVHALARRFPLLDHVYANSEASIDGHFWTSAGDVSDYVTKNWHQNYAGRERPYDFVYTVTWPSRGFLFDQAEKQGISYFNYGEAIAGMVYQVPDIDRSGADAAKIVAKQAKSDIGTPATPIGCYPNDASIGTDAILSLGPLPDVETYDSSLPKGAPLGSLSRFNCFKNRFNSQVSQGRVPAFNYMSLPSDHTQGTSPGKRTPRAMIAENDYALGQIVELISHSSVWKSSLILVLEDDSQDGADHVDAHRIPALAISPYAKRGAVVHTRYDFLSLIRTLEITIGMKPLNLFDALAVPMYDAFSSSPSNGGSYSAIGPGVNLVERNTKASPAAKVSSELPFDKTDAVPQRYLDRILWQSIHGAHSQSPPPGPNSSGLDEESWKRSGKPVP